MNQILLLVILLILSIAVISALYRFSKRLFKILGIILSILAVLSVIAGIAVIIDAKQFAQRFTTEQSLYLLQEEGGLLTGFYALQDDGAASEDKSIDELFKTLSEEKIAALQESYSSGSLDEMRDSNYKVMIFDIRTFESIPDNEFTKAFSIMTLSLDKEDVFSILRAESLPKRYSSLLERYGLASTGAAVLADAKTAMFAQLIGMSFSDDQLFLITSFRKGDVEIYTKTAFFYFLQYIPDSILETVKNGLTPDEIAIEEQQESVQEV